MTDHAHYQPEAMDRGLRDCCRSIRIGKILIRRDPDTKHAKVSGWVGLLGIRY